MLRRLLSIGCVLALGVFVPGTASARVSAESRYTKAQNYSAALRFLRVDKGFEVVERDEDAAYLIFRYPTPERKEQNVIGTIEVVEVDQSVTLIVKLPQMPQYHERLLSDQLLKKLRDEYGAPSAPKQKPEEKPPEEKKPKSAPKPGSETAPKS
ncbi:MAG TPA: hypothetical protein VI197_14145 [Polyangiaceae bacterium]